MLESPETGFAASRVKIDTGIVEGMAELDQPIQRLQQAEIVLPVRVVDGIHDRDNSAALLQRAAGFVEQNLLLQFRVVEDVTLGGFTGLRRVYYCKRAPS